MLFFLVSPNFTKIEYRENVLVAFDVAFLLFVEIEDTGLYFWTTAVTGKAETANYRLTLKISAQTDDTVS
jgi:hypothetical protein